MKRRSNSAMTVTVIFILFILAYIFNAIYNLFNKTQTPVTNISYSKIDIVKMYDGVIVRDEVVYKSPATGVLSYNISDLERVRPDSMVCTVSDKKAVSALESQLQSVNNEIMNVQKMRSEISLYYDDVKRVDKQIKDLANNHIFKLYTEQFSDLYNFNNSLEQQMDFRNQMLLNESGGSLTNVAQTRQTYNERIAAGTSLIRTETSGIVSYFYDGLEDVLTPSNLFSITKEQTHMKAPITKIVGETTINAEDIAFKIIRSNLWNIVAYIDNDEADKLRENQRKTIYIDKEGEFVPLDIFVTKISKGEKESYVCFETTKNMIDYLDVRNLNFKLEEGTRWGYKIPKTAIVDKTLLKIPNEFLDTVSNSVYKKMTDGLEKVTVITMGSDDMYTYVNMDFNLRLNDVICEKNNVINEFVISEVETVKGILFSNYGYADFKKITIEEDAVESNGYILLNPALNKSLQLGDRIVSDARFVQDGAKIY